MNETNAQSTGSAGNETLKRALGVAALSVGGIAVGYAAFRYYKRSKSDARTRETGIDRWFEDRLEELQTALALSAEQLKWLREEITPAISLGNKIWRKAEKLSPADIEKMILAAEKHIVKIKLRVRKMLELTEEAQLNALHAFYEELRQIVLGLIPEIRSVESNEPELQET